MKYVETRIERLPDKTVKEVIQEWDNIDDVMSYILDVLHEQEPEVPILELQESTFFNTSRYYLTEPECCIGINLGSTCINQVY